MTDPWTNMECDFGPSLSIPLCSIIIAAYSLPRCLPKLVDYALVGHFKPRRPHHQKHDNVRAYVSLKQVVQYTVRRRYNSVNFLENPLKIHPMSRPLNSLVGARYGVTFVSSHTDLCLASVTVMMYAISCHIGPRYNGTRLYESSYMLYQFTALMWSKSSLAKDKDPSICIHISAATTDGMATQGAGVLISQKWKR